MDARTFVAGLVAEMRELFAGLGELGALEAESKGRVEIPTLLELAIGNLNGPQAYLSGRLRMKGDVMLAQRLTTLIAVPNAARPAA